MGHVCRYNWNLVATLNTFTFLWMSDTWGAYSKYQQWDNGICYCSEARGGLDFLSKTRQKGSKKLDGRKMWLSSTTKKGMVTITQPKSVARCTRQDGSPVVRTGFAQENVPSAQTRLLCNLTVKQINSCFSKSWIWWDDWFKIAYSVTTKAVSSWTTPTSISAVYRACWSAHHISNTLLSI